MTKSYLSRQIKLITLKTSDLFTDSELEKHVRLLKLKNEKAKLQKEKNPDQISIQLLSEEIKKAYTDFKEELKNNKDLTRSVNPRCVCDYTYFTEQNGVKISPDAISWDNLKLSRKICEFESELSRAMGVKEDEVTFDKIIIQWKSLEMLYSICMHGFTMPIYCNDGESIETRKFKFFTASAGQLRTDKIQCISERMQKKIAPIVECGMDELRINTKGGINANKYMAYRALASSATDRWDFDIRKAIVIPDFEAPVTGVMDYITEQYTIERGIRTVMINHTDGSGMAKPGVMPARNCMVRGPWLKGLISEFDYLAFCREHGVPAVLKDVWGKEHDLIAEDIQIIFTESQLKLAGYYDSWDEYVNFFISCGCHLGLTNYEENYIANSPLNYQMLQTLTELTDNDIVNITEKELQYLKDLGKDTNKMLEALRADANSNNAYRIMLKIYPEMLRDALAKDSIKLTRKKRQMDDKSGQLTLNNKRLFAIPDFYAACQFWFEHNPEPEGLLKDGYIYSRMLRDANEIDVLRSPHLYMEHAIRKVDTSDEVRKWFRTNGVYTSCHDLISRILQFDVDGDQLNCVDDEYIIGAAKRTIAKFDIVPLFYDAYKAPKAPLTPENNYLALKRAHDFSGIGQVSNRLTKLWNMERPDVLAAAFLCRYNNAVIDAAKCGKVNSYEDYPDIKQRVNSASGGRCGKMPHFFQFTKNGRRVDGTPAEDCLPPNDSVMNKICRRFDNIGRLDFRFVNLPPFNYKMLLSVEDTDYDEAVVDAFLEAAKEKTHIGILENKQSDLANRYGKFKTQLLIQTIKTKVEEVAPLERAYSTLTRYMFKDSGIDKSSYKREYWQVFGSMALQRYLDNKEHAVRCDKCQMLLPVNDTTHECPKALSGFVKCKGCGRLVPRFNSRQIRCPDCQAKYRRNKMQENSRKIRESKAAQGA